MMSGGTSNGLWSRRKDRVWVNKSKLTEASIPTRDMESLAATHNVLEEPVDVIEDDKRRHQQWFLLVVHGDAVALEFPVLSGDGVHQRKSIAENARIFIKLLFPCVCISIRIILLSPFANFETME